MLLNILINAFRQLRDRRPRNENIKVVCATRMTKNKFWSESPMGISLKKLEIISNRIMWEVFFENKEGLPKVYNRAIKTASKNEILVFVHDDVWLNEENFIDSLDNGLRRYGVVGVAGNVRILKGQAAWLFKSIENGKFIWDWGHLSGSVWHRQNPHPPAITEYGPMAKCELLDGVFISCRAKTLKRKNILFDEQFDFHFYDMDFCRSARMAKLALGTWPIPLVHESGGDFGGDGWLRNLEIYRNKWES